MQNYKLIVEYDGSNYFGFQLQPNHPTIQKKIEEALSRLFDRQMKISSASGRTDTGVHAENQVVHFRVDAGLTNHQILMGLNRYLPPDIAVKKVQKVSGDFHARFIAKSKIYEYRVWNHQVRSPLKSRYVFHFPFPLDLERMRKGALKLKGKHDFAAFCGSGSSVKDTVRNINRFTLSRKGHLILFRVEADGFLQHMVRNLVGTLLDLGRGKIALSDINKILVSKDRKRAGMKVPAQGLTLIQVKY